MTFIFYSFRLRDERQENITHDLRRVLALEPVEQHEFPRAQRRPVDDEHIEQ